MLIFNKSRMPQSRETHKKMYLLNSVCKGNFYQTYDCLESFVAVLLYTVLLTYSILEMQSAAQ